MNVTYKACYVIHSQLSPSRSPCRMAAHNASDIRIRFFSFRMESDLQRPRKIRPYNREGRKIVNEKSQ